MIYRGFDIKVPFPPGSGPIEVVQSSGPDSGKVVATFDCRKTDEEVMDWIDRYRRGEVPNRRGEFS